MTPDKLAALADAIDPRAVLSNAITTFSGAQVVVSRADLIAASDALRSCATIAADARRAGMLEAARVCDISAAAHEIGVDALGSEHPKAMAVLERGKLADELATSIRERAGRTVDLVEKVARAIYEARPIEEEDGEYISETSTQPTRRIPWEELLSRTDDYPDEADISRATARAALRAAGLVGEEG